MSMKSIKSQLIYHCKFVTESIHSYRKPAVNCITSINIHQRNFTIIEINIDFVQK